MVITQQQLQQTIPTLPLPQVAINAKNAPLRSQLDLFMFSGNANTEERKKSEQNENENEKGELLNVIILLRNKQKKA